MTLRANTDLVGPAVQNAQAAQAAAESARDTTLTARDATLTARTATETARDIALAAADVAADLGNAPLYAALADLPTADGTQGWAIIPFGADQGLYRDVAGSPAAWVKQADTAAVLAAAQVALAEAEADRAEEEADRAEAAADGLASLVNSLDDIARYSGMERRPITATTAIGRAYMLPTGAFAFAGATNQLRPHYEGGVLKGYYQEVAETVKSARWHDEIPTSGSRHWPTGSNLGTGAAVALPTTHSTPDRFGGTGGGMLFTQGTSLANGQRRFDNNTESFVAGDIARVECIFSIISVTGAATFRPIRTRQISGTVPLLTPSVAFDADGIVDPDSLVLPSPSLVLRGRLDRLEDTVIGAVPVWKVWMDVPMTATGVMATAWDEPSALVGAQIMIHEQRIIPNPKGAPSPLPVCQDSFTPAPDVLAIGAAGEAFDVEFRRLARKHSRQAGNALQVAAIDQGANRYAMSGPIWPYEDEIVIRPAAEATGYAGILPSRNAAVDYEPLQLRKAWTLRGKGYFAEPVISITAGDPGDIDLRGFSDTDYLEIPWVTAFTSGAEQPNQRFDVVVYSASSTFTAQREQVEVGENLVSDFQVGATFTSHLFGLVSHPLAHSRARRFSFPRVQADGENPHYMGTFIIKPQTTCLSTIHNVTASGVGRGWQLVSNGTTVQVTLDWDNWEIDDFTSDGYFLGRGAVQPGSVIQNIVISNSGYLRENLFHTAPDMPLWIDTGAGFESIEDYAAAQSMTVAEVVDTLPIGRRFQYYGYLDTPYSGAPDRTLADLVIDPSPVHYVPFSAAAVGNTGMGTIGSLTAAEPLAEGAYRLTIIAAATDAGTFQVTGPNGYYATGTVGVAFSRGGLAFTLADAATDFVVGDNFTIWVKRFAFDNCSMEVTRWTVGATVTTNIAADAPGYQFLATNRKFRDGYNDNVLPHDSAWVSTGGKAASAGNPHLLLVRGDGERDATTEEWVAGTHPDAQPVLNNAGMHADPFQGNRGGITFSGTTFRNWVVKSRGQGALFCPGTQVNMFVNLLIENFFAAITGGNGILLGPGTVSAIISKMFLAGLWTDQCTSTGTKNQVGMRVQGGTTTLTDGYVAVRPLNATTLVNTGFTVDAGATLTGTPGIIRHSQNAYNFVEPVTPLRVGAEVTQPGITSLVANPDMLLNGYFNGKSNLREWAFSEFGIRHLGFDPLLGARNVFGAPAQREKLHAFRKEVLHQHPIAHGEMVNTLAVGEEIELYDEDGVLTRLPGHTIDFHFGDGYGKDGPWRISEDGRVFLRWSLAGRDTFRRILTRRPDGSYGPIFTIDVVVP